MPASFYDVLPIDGKGDIIPGGPLQLDANETVVRLDAWVWQDGGACIAVQNVFPDRDKWTTPTVLARTGAFTAGAAAAMALMVWIEGGETKTYQWIKGITLK